MLASMMHIDPRADTPLVNWSDLGLSGLLPTGTVTLLLADVEGSTRLWAAQTDEMTAAVARLNRTVTSWYGAQRAFPLGPEDSARAVSVPGGALGFSVATAAPRANAAVAATITTTASASANLPTSLV
jgi:hypothetical protein